MWIGFEKPPKFTHAYPAPAVPLECNHVRLESLPEPHFLSQTYGQSLKRERLTAQTFGHANFDSQKCILQHAPVGHISDAAATMHCITFNQLLSIHFEKNWITSTWNLKSHNSCSPVASLALGTVHRSRSVHRGGKGTKVTFGIEFLFLN